MLRYRLIWVGKKNSDAIVEAASIYLTRLTHYCKIEIIRLQDGEKDAEGKAMLRKLQDDDYVVALDERGLQLSTRAWAEKIKQWQNQAKKSVSFVIGGADGLHEEVKKRSQERWSLSSLTLPHRLAYLIWTEQMYRTHTLLRGEPYHRD